MYVCVFTNDGSLFVLEGSTGWRQTDGPDVSVECGWTMNLEYGYVVSVGCGHILFMYTYIDDFEFQSSSLVGVPQVVLTQSNTDTTRILYVIPL